MTVHLSLKLWCFAGPTSWYMVTLPKEFSGDIRAMLPPKRVGFGAVPVSVTSGPAQWTTSIFPDSKSGSYVLPVKASVRQKLKLNEGDTFELTIMLRV